MSFAIADSGHDAFVIVQQQRANPIFVERERFVIVSGARQGAPGPGGSGGGSGGPGVRIVPITLTSANIASRSVTLPQQPSDPTLISITPRHGIAQFPGVDFVVSGALVSWSSLALEALVETGQTLLFIYQT